MVVAGVTGMGLLPRTGGMREVVVVLHMRHREHTGMVLREVAMLGLLAARMECRTREVAVGDRRVRHQRVGIATVQRAL